MVKIDYNIQKQCQITPLNVIGVTDSLTLRTVTAHTDLNCRYVAENGSDTTGAGTQANPWRTIQYAIDNLGGFQIITFLRNGMTGEIHSYQNVWRNQNAIPSNLTIQTELGENQIFLHWKEERITTPASVLNYNKIIVIPISSTSYRLLAFYSLGGRYSDDGYNFNNIPVIPPQPIIDADWIFPINLFTPVNCIVCLGAGGGLYYTQDGIAYTLIPGSAVVSGYKHSTFVRVGGSTGYDLIIAVRNNASTTIDKYTTTGILSSITPVSPVTNGKARDKNFKYVYFTHTDNVVRRYSSNLSVGENCTGLPTTRSYSQLIEFNNKIIAVGTGLFSAMYITESKADSYTPPNFKQIVIPFSNIVSVGKIGKYKNQINNYLNNEELFIVHCLDNGVITRYISDDLETWTIWNNQSFSDNNTDEFIEFRNNLYGITKGIVQNIYFIPLSNFSFKMANSTHKTTINGFNIDGDSDYSHKAIYGVRGDIFRTQNAVIDLKFNTFFNQLENQISNVYGIHSGNQLNIKNNFLKGKKITRNCIEIIDDSDRNYLYNNIIINSKNIGIYANNEVLGNNVIYGHSIGLLINNNLNNIVQNIFYKNGYDIYSYNTIDAPPVSNNLFSSLLIGYNPSVSDILGYDPLFVNEELEDFHIQTRERLAPNGRYYPLDSICKAKFNPEPYPFISTPTLDIGAFWELREILSYTNDDIDLKNIKSVEIFSDPVDSQSGFSYKGSYLANYKEIALQFDFTFGNERQIDYYDIFKINDMIASRGVKRLYPNGKGMTGYLNQAFDDSKLTITISPDPIPEFNFNELVGKWAYIVDPLFPNDGYSNIIRSNTKNTITIINNGSLPSSGNYDIYIVNGILCYNGIWVPNPSNLQYILQHPITLNDITPVLPPNIYKNFWLTFPYLSYLGPMYFRIKGNNGNTLFLENVIGYSAITFVNEITVAMIEFVYGRNELQKSSVVQENFNSFTDGGALFGVREGKKFNEYRLEKLSMYVTDEFV